MCGDWLTYVDSKRQFSFLRTLETLSCFQDHDTLNFIVIGALPLLFAGYLKYTVFWDFDLLFTSEAALMKFKGMKKPDDQFLIDTPLQDFSLRWHQWFGHIDESPAVVALWLLT